MNNIPEISSSGVDGSQVVGTAIIPSSVAPPLQTASVPDAIDGLIATHSRNLGGDVAARLLAASMRDTSNQLAAAHHKISELSDDLKDSSMTISNLRVQKARIESRLEEVIGGNRIKNASVFVGTAILGVAVDLFKNNSMVPALLLSILGASLLIFVVLPFSGGKNNE